MASCRRRTPLSDLSNLSPPSQSAELLPKSKPTDAARVLLHDAAPGYRSELSSDGGGQATASTLSPACLTPLSQPAPAAMEIDVCTPQATEPELSAPHSSKGESFVIYSRRKAEAPSDLIRSCPPPRHYNKTRNPLEDRDRNKAVKRGFSAAMLREDVSYKYRRHSLPSFPKKTWLPEEFVAAQRSHFAEVDAFQLSEEEGDLSDEG